LPTSNISKSSEDHVTEVLRMLEEMDDDDEPEFE